MKKQHVPVAFTNTEVINFIARFNYKLEEQIKALKQEHNTLKDRYFNVISESNLKQIHLREISKEYNELLLNISDLLSLHKETPYISSIRELSEVVECTMFKIWEYMYERAMY